MKSVHVNLHQLAFRDAVGAVAAEHRFVFGGVAHEKIAVLLRGEIVKCAVATEAEFWFALHRFTVSEKGDRIVALDGDAGFVEVEEAFGLGEGRQRQSQSEKQQR